MLEKIVNVSEILFYLGIRKTKRDVQAAIVFSEGPANSKTTDNMQTQLWPKVADLYQVL